MFVEQPLALLGLLINLQVHSFRFNLEKRISLATPKLSFLLQDFDFYPFLPTCLKRFKDYESDKCIKSNLSRKCMKKCLGIYSMTLFSRQIWKISGKQQWPLVQPGRTELGASVWNELHTDPLHSNFVFSPKLYINICM